MLQGVGAGLADASGMVRKLTPLDGTPGKLARESTIKITIRILAMEAL
jgi:hypothetical protein